MSNHVHHEKFFYKDLNKEVCQVIAAIIVWFRDHPQFEWSNLTNYDEESYILVGYIDPKEHG